MNNQLLVDLSRFNNKKFNVLDSLDARLEQLQDFRLHELEDEKLELILNLFNAHKKATKIVKNYNKFITRLLKYTNLLDSDNLKLYDLNYHIFRNSDKYVIDELGANYDYFGLFCEDEYRTYEEWLKEETYLKDHHLIVKYINRTSSFYYLDLDDFYDYFSNYNLVDEQVLGAEILDADYDRQTVSLTSMETILDCLISLLDRYNNRDEDDYLDDFEEYVNGLIESLENLVNFDYKNILDYYEDQIKVYQYVNRFKSKQVEYFDSWFEGLKESFLYN